MMKEKKLSNSIMPVNIFGTNQILHQMMNCICKIKIKGANGTGFFCRILFGNNESKEFLMTNHHVLDKKYCENNFMINLLINDENEIKTLDLRNKRIIYFDKENDITLIELNKNDGIKYCLELDDNLFRHNNKILYEDKSIYVLQYPQGKNAAVSYGLLISLDNLEIKHTCSTEFGSSGSPILNLETNKVIGIHKEGSSFFEFNKGTYLKYFLIDFTNKNSNNNNNINLKQVKIIHNNPKTNIINKNKNIKYNKNFFKKNAIEDLNYINKVNIIKKEKIKPSTNIVIHNKIKHDQKVNVIFEDAHQKVALTLNKNATVDEMLTNYLKAINKPELIGNKNNPRFLFNTKELLFGDITPISSNFNNFSIITVLWPGDINE